MQGNLRFAGAPFELPLPGGRDAVLAEVAAQLRRAVRDVDMVGRTGGDEFLGQPCGGEIVRPTGAGRPDAAARGMGKRSVDVTIQGINVQAVP